MTASHDEMLDNVAAYALGALPISEREAVEQHLQTCAECAAEYRFLRPAVTAVAYSAEFRVDAGSGAAVASPMLKARIMRRVRAQVEAPRFPAATWPAYALAAACLAIAILTAGQDIRLHRQLEAAKAQATLQKQTLADLTAADARRYAFGRGEVVARGQRLYLAIRDLPPLPADRVYQAWTLPKGSTKMVPSSTFVPAAGGTTLLRLAQTGAPITAVAVSVEPAGGSKQPTTKPIAVVSI